MKKKLTTALSGCANPPAAGLVPVGQAAVAVLLTESCAFGVLEPSDSRSAVAFRAQYASLVIALGPAGPVTTRASQLDVPERIESKKRSVTVGETSGAAIRKPPAVAISPCGQLAEAVGPI